MRTNLLIIIALMAANPALHAKTLFVTPGSEGDGSTWSQASGSVQFAIDSAVAGDEVWLSGGLYSEHITLKNGVNLYGGFAGTEASRDPRIGAESTLDGGGQGTVVTAGSGVNSVIDGITIQNGFGSPAPAGTTNNPDVVGGGIFASAAVLTLSNDKFLNNGGAQGGVSNAAGAIFCLDSAIVISNSKLMRNSATVEPSNILVQGGSLVLDQVSVLGKVNLVIPPCLDMSKASLFMRNCHIETGEGIGIDAGNLSVEITDNDLGSSPINGKSTTFAIERNKFGSLNWVGAGTVERNTLQGQGGISAQEIGPGTLTIDNNLVAGGDAANGILGSESGGGKLQIVNNTIVGMMETNALNVQTDGTGTALAANNIVAFNSWDHRRPSGYGLVYSMGATILNNDVYGNSNDYMAGQSQTGVAGNIAADPLFQGYQAGFDTLRPSSPCVDAGDDASSTVSALDLSGLPRKVGIHVDMGAYETPPGAEDLWVAIGALRAAGGLTSTTPFQWNVETSGASRYTIDLADAVRGCRQASGLDPKP